MIGYIGIVLLFIRKRAWWRCKNLEYLAYLTKIMVQNMPLESKKMSKNFDILKNNLIFAAPFNLCFWQGIEGKKAQLGAEKFFWKVLDFR